MVRREHHATKTSFTNSTVRTKPLIRKSSSKFHGWALPAAINNAFLFHVPFFPFLSLSFSRECARGMCIRDCGASLGVVRIDEGPLIIVPSLRQDESCICILAPLSFIRSLSLSLFLIRSSYLSPSYLPFSLFLTLFLPSGVIPDRHWVFVCSRTNWRTVRSLCLSWSRKGLCGS